jgi:hypothetical protein
MLVTVETRLSGSEELPGRGSNTIEGGPVREREETEGA